MAGERGRTPKNPVGLLRAAPGCKTICMGALFEGSLPDIGFKPDQDEPLPDQKRALNQHPVGSE